MLCNANPKSKKENKTTKEEWSQGVREKLN